MGAAHYLWNRVSIAGSTDCEITSKPDTVSNLFCTTYAVFPSSYNKKCACGSARYNLKATWNIFIAFLYVQEA